MYQYMIFGTEFLSILKGTSVDIPYWWFLSTCFEFLNILQACRAQPGSLFACRVLGFMHQHMHWTKAHYIRFINCCLAAPLPVPASARPGAGAGSWQVETDFQNASCVQMSRSKNATPIASLEIGVKSICLAPNQWLAPKSGFDVCRTSNNWWLPRRCNLPISLVHMNLALWSN